MIQHQTILKVSDNSGAKTVKCIKVLGGFKKKTAKIGQVIVVSIQKLRNKLRKNSKIKKGEIYKALVIRTKKTVKTKNGFCLLLYENSVILINKNENIIGTRIIGPLPKVLKKKFNRFSSVSAGFI